MKDFEKYIDKVRSQLECNASEEYKSNYITYDYTNQQVDDNLNYFRDCMDHGLSEYKSLLFFGDYLVGDYKF